MPDGQIFGRLTANGYRIQSIRSDGTGMNDQPASIHGEQKSVSTLFKQIH